MVQPLFLTLSLLAAGGFAVAASAEDYVITLKDHQFTPQVLEVPAGQAVDVIVKNDQSTPGEFESSDLGREKVVAANSQIVVKLAPLKAGDYKYVDDFHEETTGTITAK